MRNIARTVMSVLLISVSCLVFPVVNTLNAAEKMTNETVAEKMLSVKGWVRGVADPSLSKTVSVEVENKGFMVFKYTGDTVFKNFQYIDELRDETVVVEYSVAGPDNEAAVITRALVNLPRGLKEIETQEMEALLQKGHVAGDFFLIDARPFKRYEEGHIPGAVSIPVAKLEHDRSRLLPSDKNTTLLFYGGGPTCDMSLKSAELALKWGYENIKIYLAGEPEWKKSGHYTVSTPEFLKEGNVVLIDLRPEKAVMDGHIPGAVRMSIKELVGSHDQFPLYMGAHIIFYSDSMTELVSAVRIAQGWGYRNSTIFYGATGAWELAGNELAAGPAAEKIKYKRMFQPGEISIEEFEKTMISGNAVIIDVRNQKEFTAGHFRRAINIPLDDISSEYGILPKGRPILVYCVTGIRAEIAYNILKEHSLNVKFLNAAPVFNPDGGYEIRE